MIRHFFQLLSTLHQVFKCNGNPITEDLIPADVLSVWTTGLKKPIGLLIGYTQQRLGGAIRCFYRTKEAVDLTSFVSTPFFSFTKTLSVGTR